MLPNNIPTEEAFQIKLKELACSAQKKLGEYPMVPYEVSQQVESNRCSPKSLLACLQQYKGELDEANERRHRELLVRAFPPSSSALLHAPISTRTHTEHLQPGCYNSFGCNNPL